MSTKTKQRVSESSNATQVQGPEGDLDLPQNKGHISYTASFLTAEESRQLQQDTQNAQSWKRTPITFFGKSVLQPRDTAFFGTALYSYSEERRRPTGWDEDLPASHALKRLAERIERTNGLPPNWFNVVLANRYMNGRDFMGWHADNEKSLGDLPVIASVSVGAERRFVVRCNEHKMSKIEYLLRDGSLLVMSGRMQQFYQHSLPKVALSKCNDLRLNFTFRRVVDDSDHSKQFATDITKWWKLKTK